MADEQCQRETVTHDEQEDGHHGIGDRRRKQRHLLLTQQDRKTSHAAVLDDGRVRSRKTRSRSGRASVSSETPMPALTSAATMSAARDGRGSALIRYLFVVESGSGSTAMSRTPAI